MNPWMKWILLLMVAGAFFLFQGRILDNLWGETQKRFQ